jgi:hypothetical protein
MPIYGPFQTPYFAPASNDITAITNAYPASVTTYSPHGWFNGAVVRLYIPLNFGMQQANRMKGIIMVTGASSFSINIDTRAFDPFVVPSEQPGNNFTPAQCINVGEFANTLDNAFVNISTPI